MRVSNRKECVQQIERARIVAVIRVQTTAAALFVGRALAEAGIRVLEITSTVPDAADVIHQLRAELPPECVVGAGTITTTAEAQAMIDAGAQFVVSPIAVVDLIPLCHACDIVCVPAGLTPTELQAAFNAGADLVKLFPAAAVGGPRYIRDLLAPLPHLPIMASGGVELDNMRAYLEAGCRCVGLGGTLLPTSLVAARDHAGLVAHAQRCLALLEETA